jgi:O-antigen ligase
LPISFFEFYDLYNFKVIIAGLYFPSFSGDLGGKEFNIGADQYISAFENEAFTYRALGFTGNANMTAIFYSICASIITVFLLNTKRWINIIFFSAILLACLALILTVFGSRTATLIVIINFILFALLNRKNRLQINTRILSIVFLIVTLISILLANDLIQDRVIGTIDEYAVSQDLVQTSGRSDFWDERFEDYYKYSNPVSLFIGLGYTKLFEDFADNGLLSSFMNRGLIGFTFHVIFILLILFQFRKVSRLTYYTYYPLIFYAILACCIFFEGTGDPSEHYKFGQFYFLFACLLFKSINDQKLLNKNQ